MEEASNTRVSSDHVLSEGRPMPLNSKRLTSAYAQAIARAMQLPSGASLAETTQMIEGKLGDSNREPANVQVIIHHDSQNADFVSLRDASGVFLGPVPAVSSTETVGSRDDSRRTGVSDEIGTENSNGGKNLEEALIASRELNEQLETRLSSLTDELKQVKGRIEELWRLNCSQVAVFDDTISAKDAEIEQLANRIAELESGLSHSSEDLANHVTQLPQSLPSIPLPIVHSRRGKAPPVSEFSGEDSDFQLDDWLPSLERASLWNNWSMDEKLMQFAGHLKGRALQEYNLLRTEEKESFTTIIAALRNRLDPGSRATAAQDFRHAAQGESELVSDFVRRLERLFRVAYGRDQMLPETRDTLLHGQLQEGLRYALMRGPGVSGATKYQELCVAAKNEEKRLADLQKRQQYSRLTRPNYKHPHYDHGRSTNNEPSAHSVPQNKSGTQEPRKCHFCKKPGHLMRDCKKRAGRSSSGQPVTKQVTLQHPQKGGPEPPNPLDFLFSSDSENDDCGMKNIITDEGSRPQLAQIMVQGVPAVGVIDTGADITIMGKELFARVAAASRIRKRMFRKPDKTPQTYDRKTFRLDGCMDLELSFADKTMKTAVYVKMDAHDQLLLSEGVCRQLGIVSYHPSVISTKVKKKSVTVVPTVRVNLVQSLRLVPNQAAIVSVKVTGDSTIPDCPLMMLNHTDVEQQTGLTIVDAVITPDTCGMSQIVVANHTRVTQAVQEGAYLGEAEKAQLVAAPIPNDSSCQDVSTVQQIISPNQAAWRKKKVAETLELPHLPSPDRKLLQQFLADHHHVFCLEEGERGETDLIQMEIITDGASPRKQPPRRMPFTIRQEVARQLKRMQQNGVIQPSHSSWSSPVVMVRKKDGSHRFCVDYRGLNAVTKADKFPLPRVDDLLDNLNGARYFSTLDLASGFWQIRMEASSQEKTAFVTPNGLYEFRVMPFGLTNAPSVFQRLIQQVVAGLNPEDGHEFVTAYIDDILVYSPTLLDHIDHLQKVIDRLEEVNLKLNPMKCKFVREEVEFLGHVITANGVKPNLRLTDAVQKFPQPRKVQDVRRFIGMASYYRRFISNFAKIAHPLHQLTRKDVPFYWTAECEVAFTSLKTLLTTPPVLAYPCVEKDFTLETDASIRGLGAVLSQEQEDGKRHPVAYASRALNSSEKNYSVTELETLAVVWAISHFHTQLYGQKVTVLTDHSAVKAVLETPNPSGKHARWWTKVFGRGVGAVHIVYRAGRDNVSADALSRQPHRPAPVLGIAQDEIQVAAISVDSEISELLEAQPAQEALLDHYSVEQQKDPALKEIIEFLRNGKLPEDSTSAKKLSAQESLFALVNNVLYYIDPRHDNRKRVAVPAHLREQLLTDSHRGIFSGHFSGNRVYNSLMRHWWWPGMYVDSVAWCKRCPECAITTGAGQQHKPPLKPIPVQRPFQIIGLDIMDLPRTEQGNKHVIVFQDMFTKWPLVFPAPDQKTERIVRLLCEEVVPLFGVPEALLTDRGTNLLSHLMLDVCAKLGIKKLNTTAYHPECDGMIERFNRTLKSMLRKRAAQYGSQWDKFLNAALWAYRNTPHETTGEKPSFLLFGFDCRSPAEAAFLPVEDFIPTSVDDYRETLMLHLSLARKSALESISKSQQRYKHQYDRKVKPYKYTIGAWVLIRFPAEETGKRRKLSHPWHGPYRITSCDETNVTAVKVYFPLEDAIKVHQNRVKSCPGGFLAGYYWYGNKRKGPGRPPKWVEKVLSGTTGTNTSTSDVTPEGNDESPESGTSSKGDPPVITDTPTPVSRNDKNGDDESSRRPGRYHLRQRP